MLRRLHDAFMLGHEVIATILTWRSSQRWVGACRFRGPAGARLLSRRGSLVVRKLAGLLGGEKVFSALAASLEHETDLQFAASMVQALNLILLTAPEVRASSATNTSCTQEGQSQLHVLCPWLRLA